MAEAAPPGVGERTERATQARRRFIVTIHRDGGDDETYELTPSTLSFRERTLVRRLTQLSIGTYLAPPYEVDNLQVMVWMARRQAGETSLSLAEVEDAWPDLPQSSFDLSVDDGEGSDPQP